MKNITSVPARWLATALATLAAVTILTGNVHAQNNAPQPPAKAKEELPYKASVARTENGDLLYSMKFDGGNVLRLQAAVETAFPEDNFLQTESAANGRLPSFEIRHVRITELARSIAFLSEGTLTVEVVPKDATMPGNIWRIAGPASGNALSSFKMRAVAAPHLTGDPDKFKRLLDQAKVIEAEREERAVMAGSRTTRTQVNPLSDQKVIVLIGSEDGIAGMESLIKACEQVAAEEARVDEEAKKAELALRAKRDEAVRDEQAKRAADVEKAKKNGQ